MSLNLTKQELKQIILEEFDKEMQIQEMIDLDPSMIAGGVAALGSLWYMIKAMKDSVEAGRTKEADEYMADIHRIMAKHGLKVPPSPGKGSSPRSAETARQLADLKAQRRFKSLPEPGMEPESDMPLLGPEDDAEVDIDPKDLNRYVSIVNTIRSNAGLNHKTFKSAPKRVKMSIARQIQKVAASLIAKYGKENLDIALEDSANIYEQ